MASKYSAAAGDSVTHNQRSAAVGNDQAMYDMVSGGNTAMQYEQQSIGVGKTSIGMQDIGAGESVARDLVSKGQQNSLYQETRGQQMTKPASQYSAGVGVSYN